MLWKIVSLMVVSARRLLNIVLVSSKNTLRIQAWDCKAELAGPPREDFHIFLSA